MKSSTIINQILSLPGRQEEGKRGNRALTAYFKTIGKVKKAHCLKCLKLPESTVISAMYPHLSLLKRPKLNLQVHL